MCTPVSLQKKCPSNGRNKVGCAVTSRGERKNKRENIRFMAREVKKIRNPGRTDGSIVRRRAVPQDKCGGPDGDNVAVRNFRPLLIAQERIV